VELDAQCLKETFRLLAFDDNVTTRAASWATLAAGITQASIVKALELLTAFMILVAAPGDLIKAQSPFTTKPPGTHCTAAAFWIARSRGAPIPLTS
jgi:hypothetical protein